METVTLDDAIGLIDARLARGGVPKPAKKSAKAEPAPVAVDKAPPAAKPKRAQKKAGADAA